jgi:hypothetical protein
VRTQITGTRQFVVVYAHEISKLHNDATKGILFLMKRQNVCNCKEHPSPHIANHILTENILAKNCQYLKFYGCVCIVEIS